MKMLKTILKWFKFAVIALLVVLVAAYLVIYVMSQRRMEKTYSYTDAEIEIPTDSISLAKGKHIYQIRGCQDCHGEKGEGSVFMNSKMLMELTAPNLTKGRGGVAGDFQTADWMRVLRHGVDKSGRSLFMMPSNETAQLTNEDLVNVIAYCRQLKPVSSSQERLHSIGPVGRLLLVMDNVTVLPAEKIDHQASYTEKSDEVTGVKYGEYLASSCQGCHRSDMRGGGPLAPGFPPVPNITAEGNISKWTDQSFIATIRTGKTPDGRILNNEFMPWKSISRFTDDELRSIYMYLRNSGKQ